MQGVKEIKVKPDQSTVPVHLLNGVTIEHEGEALVSAYFKPSSTGNNVDGHEVQQASFRGRNLQGVNLHLPEGYTGTVLTCSAQADSEHGDEKLWSVSNTFHSLHCWNHDTVPLKGDGIRRCLEWASLAVKIHQSIDPDSLVE